MKIAQNILVIFISSLLSCKPDSEKAAIEYCKCLQENNSNNKPLLAFKYCQAKLISKYPLYKYYNLDMTYDGSYSVDDSIRKEAMKFEEEFNDYTFLHCCKEVHGCQLLKDTFFIKQSKILQKYRR